MNIIKFPIERTRQTPDSFERQLELLLAENQRISDELAELQLWYQTQYDELQKVRL